MQSTSSETQVTQSGQAIAINNMCCAQLSELFAPMLGPHGSMKVLVSGGQQLSITKDGNSLCRDIQYTHPTSILITRAASSFYNSFGDGTTTFVLLTCECFKEAYKYYLEGASLPAIINSLQLALKECTETLQSSAMPLNDATLRQLAHTSLGTKLNYPEALVDIVLKALGSFQKTLDVNMVEIIKMEDGDITDSVFVDGLVLDHGGRHYLMPARLENACVLTTNMSLEYEKPEVNAEFCYSSATQREQLAATERSFILEKTQKIVELAESLKTEGRSLVVISEKGIDQYSLELLGSAGILALRRAKRRNLERLMGACGGNIVTQPSQLVKANLGFCQRVSVKDIGENKYTFIEGTPLKGACTILLRGDVDYERTSKSIRGTLHSLVIALQSKCIVYGGISLYRELIRSLAKKITDLHESDVVGYKVMISVLENLIKTLLRNESQNISEGMVKVFREDGFDERVVENIKVVSGCLSNATVMAINLLMCDEIILAGRSINQPAVEQ